MLTLNQLILEATALSGANKVILTDKVVESLEEQIDRDVRRRGIQTAQDCIDEIESGAVQTIPGDISLAQLSGF